MLRITILPWYDQNLVSLSHEAGPKIVFPNMEVSWREGIAVKTSLASPAFAAISFLPSICLTTNLGGSVMLLYFWRSVADGCGVYEEPSLGQSTAKVSKSASTRLSISLRWSQTPAISKASTQYTFLLFNKLYQQSWKYNGKPASNLAFFINHMRMTNSAPMRKAIHRFSASVPHLIPKQLSWNARHTSSLPSVVITLSKGPAPHSKCLVELSNTIENRTSMHSQQTHLIEYQKLPSSKPHN